MKVFKEEQRFTQTWLVVILAISVIVSVASISQKYFDENATISTNRYVISLVTIIISLSTIFFFKLTTRIDEKGIHYQFFPFHFKLRIINWNEVSKAYVRTYNPILDYGGWGLKGRWSKPKGKAINVSGDVGIQLELKNGKKLLVGTKKENNAKSVLATYQLKISEL